MDKRISDDSREKLEADIAGYFACWFGGGENTRKEIIGWLDRQAAITAAANAKLIAEQARAIVDLRRKLDELEQESIVCGGTAADWYRVVHKKNAEIDELKAKLDAYDETHMLLPIDADGVPIRVGETCYDKHTGEQFEVSSVEWNNVCWSAWSKPETRHIYSEVTHVKPRTIEDVLREIVELAQYPSAGKIDDGDIEGFAAEIRELLGSDGV